MRLHIITVFPNLIRPYTDDSILKRAISAGLVEFHFYNPRDFSLERHQKTDGTPYGGGPGMVMSAEPILKIVKRIKELGSDKAKYKIVHFAPRGKQFTNRVAESYKKYSDIILICGRYEGVDARVKKILKGDELSIGPYVLTGGELPALVVVDAVARQIKGVLGNSDSLEERRTASSEVYTKPEVLVWDGKKHRVPPVLLSGHHGKIDEWRSKHI